MRRLLPASTLAAGLGLTLGVLASDAAAQTPAPPPAPVDWQLDQAGRDPLALDLTAFGSSSCLPGSLSATVVEAGARIEITVRSAPTAEVCTADYAPVPLTVRLSAPVRGRIVVGPRRLRRDPLAGGPPASGRRPVPRVTGLAPADAVAVVRRHGLRPQVERVADLRTRPRVVGQTPASGRRTSARATVTLFVSR
ncbi:MAG TPA: PASTA domain-containing protein [Conexibacter sp.]|nr:PASTA domain-containing protein [Conexibacter sp.]